jgi:hypothetical protein
MTCWKFEKNGEGLLIRPPTQLEMSVDDDDDNNSDEKLKLFLKESSYGKVLSIILCPPLSISTLSLSTLFLLSFVYIFFHYSQHVFVITNFVEADYSRFL